MITRKIILGTSAKMPHHEHALPELIILYLVSNLPTTWTASVSLILNTMKQIKLT